MLGSSKRPWHVGGRSFRSMPHRSRSAASGGWRPSWGNGKRRKRPSRSPSRRLQDGAFRPEVIALAYRDQGQLEEAETWLRRSLDLKRRPRTLTFLGDVLRRRGNLDEANAVLRAAISLDESYEEAYYLLAQGTADLDEAIALYRRALELDPSDGRVHRELGWALRRLDRLDEAEAHPKTRHRPRRRGPVVLDLPWEHSGGPTTTPRAPRPRSIRRSPWMTVAVPRTGVSPTA